MIERSVVQIKLTLVAHTFNDNIDVYLGKHHMGTLTKQESLYISNVDRVYKADSPTEAAYKLLEDLGYTVMNE